MTVWMEMRDGKLYIVHPSGYIAFTRQEWQRAKDAGDELFSYPNVIPGQVEK